MNNLTEGEAFLSRSTHHDRNTCKSENCRSRRKKPLMHRLSDREQLALLAGGVVIALGFFLHTTAHAAVLSGKRADNACNATYSPVTGKLYPMTDFGTCERVRDEGLRTSGASAAAIRSFCADLRVTI